MARDLRHHRHRSRLLSEEERELWQKVRQTVTPLRREEKPVTPAASPPGPAQESGDGDTGARIRPAGPPVSMPAYHPPVSRKATGSQGLIDERTRRDIIRGKRPIEDRIDLHGMTQEAAWQALSVFLARANHQGHKVVLVITGKGRTSQGVLRRMVPEWLRHPAMQPHVSAFREAHHAHGGSGALYVRIRQRRDERGKP